jgi:gliding motility-associated-like protein
LTKFTYIFLCLAGFLFFTNSFGQRGKVIKSASTSVLDPNGDGYVSISNTGFSNDGYNVDEFEIPMFGLPKSDEGEVLNDIQAGAKCGTTELTYDNRGFSVYGVHKNGNLIFRFRVANDKPSVEAYTILVDTDGRVGTDDPNSTPNNPGFEIDITLIKNNSKGVYVYNIDGIQSCPSPLLHYSLSSNFQIAVADEVSCSDPDYFYDFYVPFAAIAAQFNITLNTELRFVALTNVSATCAMSGKISDIGGVDDTPYNGCNSCAFLDLAVNQCPTSLNNLCPTCNGFLTGVTPKPTIDAPLKAGEFDITGTSLANAFVYVSIFNSSKILKEKDTVSANSSGVWLKTLAAPLALGDSITAQAKAVGQCNSGGTSSGTSFTVVVQNIPPVLAGANPGTVQYNENDPPKILSPGVTVTDPDDTEIDGATITISSNFNSGQDVLSVTNAGGVTGSFNATTGILTLTGTATLATYQSVLRSVTYSNTSENPNNAIRNISIKIFDGLDYSNIFSFNVQVNPINDAPVVFSSINVVLYSGTSIIVNTSLAITDVDNTTLTGGTVSFTNNFLNTQDGLVFVNQNGITGSYNSTTGILALTGTTTLGNYATALQSIKYSNSSGAPSQLTRRISFIVNDGVSNSSAFQSFVDFNGAVNNPPVIVDVNGNPIDNLNYTINEDSEMNACVIVNDPDGDPVTLSAFTNQNGNGTFSIPSALCFKFVPQLNQNGQVTASLTVCDQTSGSLCDIATVTITITPVNDAPVITTTTATVQENSSNNICITYTDIENDAAVFTVGSSANNSATITNGNVSDVCFTYAPNTSFVGNDPVTVTICDANDPTVCSSSLINVQVNPLPNHPPGILINGLPGNTLHIQVEEDSTAVLCFEAFDQEGDDITLSSINKITNGGGSLSTYQNIEFCFLYTPLANHNGTVEFEVTVCDNHNPNLCSVVKVIVDVIPFNDPPVILTTTFQTRQDSTATFCLQITDVENDPAIFTSGSSQLSLGTVTDPNNTDKCFTYMPKPNFFGVDNVSVTACDAADATVCTTSLLTINVLPKGNVPPIIAINGVPIDTLRFTIKEDSVLNFCLEVTDPNTGDKVSVSSITNTQGGGQFTNPNGFCFRFTPVLNFNGVSKWDLTVCDDHVPSLCTTLKVIITVTPVNDPPVIVPQIFQVVQDTAKTICLTVTDVENDGAIFTQGSTNNTLGSISDGTPGDLCFVYTPTPGKYGDDTISVTVCDVNDNTLCTTTSLTVEVLPGINLPPKIFINNLPQDTLRTAIPEDSVFSFCFTAVDPNKDPVSFASAINILGGGQMTKTADFCFTFKPAPNFNGIASWVITVCDNKTPALCGSLVVIINVTPVNDAPLAVNDTLTSLRFVQGFVNVLKNDSDVEFNKLSVNPLALLAPEHGQYLLSADGELFYTSDRYFKGVDILKYSVCDDGTPSRCSEATVMIDVGDLPLKAYEAFSPNGDGQNDYWRIEGVDFYPDNVVRVFDRYNNLVFQMDGYNNENKMWHGESNHGIFGGKLPEGTYYYAITLENGKSPLKGFVVLKRE